MNAIARRARFVASVGAIVCAASAYADAPPLQLQVTTGSFGKSFSLNPNSVSPGGVGSYMGSVDGGANTWNFNYNFSAASGAEAAAQSGTFSITNLSGAERTYNIRLTLPTTSPGTLTGLFNGSLSGTLITSGAGYMRSVTATPMWSALTNAFTVGQLFASPVNVDTLAQIAGMSSRSFQRHFKRAFQLTPTSYVRQFRIGKACQMLIETDETITTVALETGFSDHSHLVREFTRAIHTTPGAYRQKYRAK